MKKILIITCVFLMLSCEKKDEISIISSSEIFNIKKDEYYVLVYLNGCIACRDVKLRINNMEGNLKELFYYVDLELNKNLVSDKFVSNVNCTNFQELKVKKTPTLLVIKERKVNEEYVKSNNIYLFFDKLEKRNQR